MSQKEERFTVEVLIILLAMLVPVAFIVESFRDHREVLAANSQFWEPVIHPTNVEDFQSQRTFVIVSETRFVVQGLTRVVVTPEDGVPLNPGPGLDFPVFINDGRVFKKGDKVHLRLVKFASSRKFKDFIDAEAYIVK